MTHISENTVNKGVVEDNKNQQEKDTSDKNDNCFEADKMIVGSCGKLCTECKIANCADK